MRKHTKRCVDCGNVIDPNSSLRSNSLYGISNYDGRRKGALGPKGVVCFYCCGIRTQKQLRLAQTTSLYVVERACLTIAQQIIANVEGVYVAEALSDQECYENYLSKNGHNNDSKKAMSTHRVWSVTDWLGSFSRRAMTMRYFHNMGGHGSRRDVWFWDDGWLWYGKHCCRHGDICNFRRTKTRFDCSKDTSRHTCMARTLLNNE